MATTRELWAKASHFLGIPLKWSSDYEQRGKIIDAYNLEALNRLEAMPASGFAPNLEALDVLIQSLGLE